MAAGVALLTLTSACGTTDATFRPARPMDKSIEKFDLDTVDGMHDGKQQIGDGWGATRITRGDVYFADVDADNVEDALTSYTTNGGGSSSFTDWFVYRGGGPGKVHKVRRPVLSGFEDASYVERVRPVRGGFELHYYVWDGRDCNACDNRVPATMTVALRDGFPVRVKPRFGAPQTCYVPMMPHTAAVHGRLTVRVAPDPKAPQVTAARAYTSARFADPTADPDLPGDIHWVLALLSGGGDPVCGWVRASDVGLS
ncbi:hypothetical protein GCM10022220_11940 [Actinocatenispora rupis]|uniref:Uncharacterized protein n=1 Tax=Actinocatenispora rupis TaxID=519421 RepID=A0A8J3J1K4_9ACTN|nr:hypothetical protein Aru02nite_07000 [Actinocatenispora rupis]